METRANYVVVGAFVLLTTFALFVAALWLVRVQFRQSYDHYLTYITGSVTGLSKQSLVRLNGIEVGRVSDLDFDPKDVRIVIAGLDIRSGIVLHRDATVTLESAGLTGQPYLQIEGGTNAAPVLKRAPGQDYAVITYKPSGLEQIEDTAPEIAAQLSIVSKRLAALLDDRNRAAIGDTLSNVRDVTGAVARQHAALEAMVADSARAAHELTETLKTVNEASARLDQLLAKSGALPQRLDAALATLDDLSRDADQMLRDNRPQLRDFSSQGLGQLSELTGEMRGLVATLNHLAQQLDANPNSLVFGDRREGYRP